MHNDISKQFLTRLGTTFFGCMMECDSLDKQSNMFLKSAVPWKTKAWHFLWATCFPESYIAVLLIDHPSIASRNKKPHLIIANWIPRSVQHHHIKPQSILSISLLYQTSVSCIYDNRISQKCNKLWYEGRNKMTDKPTRCNNNCHQKKPR